MIYKNRCLTVRHLFNKRLEVSIVLVTDFIDFLFAHTHLMDMYGGVPYE